MPENETLTTEEMFAEGASADRRPYVVESIPEISFTAGKRIVERLEEIKGRAKAAYEGGFFMEYLSLMILFVEMWLRTFINGRGHYGDCNIISDRKTFGTLIGLCERAGMDQLVLEELRFLNSTRIGYIHKYLIAEQDYGGLVQHKPRLSLIPPMVQQYVIDELACPLTNLSDLGRPGQIVVFR